MKFDSYEITFPCRTSQLTHTTYHPGHTHHSVTHTSAPPLHPHIGCCRNATLLFIVGPPPPFCSFVLIRILCETLWLVEPVLGRLLTIGRVIGKPCWFQSLAHADFNSFLRLANHTCIYCWIYIRYI